MYSKEKFVVNYDRTHFVLFVEIKQRNRISSMD